MAESRPAPPLASWRGTVAALLALAGAVHLLVASQRTAVWSLEAAALAAAGTVQLGLAGAVTLVHRRGVWWATSVVSTVAAATWLLTRAVGYPFGPLDGSRPSVHVLEAVVVAAELAVATMAGGAVVGGQRLVGRVGPSFENLAALAIVAAAIPGIAASSWLDTYATVITADGAVTGSGHVHGSTDAGGISTSDRSVLGDELAVARATALELPTLADARDRGLVVIGAPAVGVGVQAFDPTLAPDAPHDPTRPRAWIYAHGGDDAPVVGLLYDTVGRTIPEGFTGGLDAWHLHAGECTVDGGLAVLLDPVVTGEDCRAIGGVASNRAHWMLRAWVVPGWENPSGTFAHENDLLPTG